MTCAKTDEPRKSEPSPVEASGHYASSYLEDEEQDLERVSLLHTTEHASIGDERGIRNGILSWYKGSNSVTLATCVLLLIVDIVASVPMAPRMVLFENIICRNYYGAWESDAGTRNCKIEPVQSELAQINGWKETFDTIPGMFFSLSSL